MLCFHYDKNMNIIDEHEGTIEMSVEAVMLEAADYVEQLRKSLMGWERHCPHFFRDAETAFVVELSQSLWL